MFIFIAFVSCLFHTLSSGQTNNITDQPVLGPVYTYSSNGTGLNFTFIYPQNYTFYKLSVRFTLYDFIGNEKLNPQPYAYSWYNLSNSDTTLPWAAPPVTLQSGDYIIGCFEWLQRNSTDAVLNDTLACVLTRAPVNSTIPPIANMTTSTPLVTNSAANISVYYPAILPYDVVNISSTLNATMPSMTSLISNGTYMIMNTFTYTNLSSNTLYNLCIYTSYANSKIAGTQGSTIQCQIITTSMDGLSMNTSTMGGPLMSTSTMGGPSMSTSTMGSSSNMIIPNLMVMILFCIFIFI